MPSRGWVDAGSIASRVTITTWWGCRSLGRAARWSDTGSFDKKQKRGQSPTLRSLKKVKELLLLCFSAFAAFLHPALEIADAFAQSLADIGQLPGAKDDQRNGQDEKQFHRS